MGFEEQQVYQGRVRGRGPNHPLEVTIPKYFLELLNLEKDDTIYMHYENSTSPRLILEKAESRKPLSERLGLK